MDVVRWWAVFTIGVGGLWLLWMGGGGWLLCSSLVGGGDVLWTVSVGAGHMLMFAIGWGWWVLTPFVLPCWVPVFAIGGGCWWVLTSICLTFTHWVMCIH